MIPEVIKRIKAGWSAFVKFKDLMTSKLTIWLKQILFYQCALPIESGLWVEDVDINN